MNTLWGALSVGLRCGLIWGGLFVGGFAAGVQAPPVPPGAYSFKGYGVDQGLSNLSIRAMTQDAKGFIWVGTEDGLFRLEGGRMRRFGPEEGLSDSAVDYGALSPTAEGGLWVGTQKGNVYWDGRRFSMPSEWGIQGFDQMPGLPLSQGGMIIRNAENRRFLFTGRGTPRELVGLPLVLGLVAGWRSPDGQELMVIIGTTLWTQAGQGWISRDLTGQARGAIQSMLKDRRGRIWIRSSRGLIRLASADGPIQDLSDRAILAKLDGCYLAEDGLGRIWTNTPGNLVWFDDDSAGQLGEEEGLPQGGANVLWIDREGSLGVGGDGVHRLLGRFLWNGYTRRQRLPGHVVWSLARSQDGLLWAGTSNGLAYGDAKGWHVLPETTQRNFGCMAEDGSGKLWFAPSIDEGESSRLFVRQVGHPGVESVVIGGLKPGDPIRALAWDPRGFFWMGAGPNLCRLVAKEGQWTAQREPIPTWPVDEVGIQAIAVGREGDVWVAATEGLAHWDGSVWRTLGKADGFADPTLISVTDLGQRTAWMALANTKGLFRVGLRGGKLVILEAFREPHPLATQAITSLKVDPSGALWMGTSLGVRRWDGQHLESFGRDWGLPGVDCAQNALWVDPDGDVWVGLSVGIAHCDTQANLGALRAIPSDITAITDGRGQAYLPGSPFHVPWRWRTLSFSITSLSYLNESRIQRQVRLVGFEDEWREVEGREVRYTRLPAGAFSFEVRSGRENGTWGPIARQPFHIQTPWWQTLWFYALVAGASGGALLMGFRIRERILMSRMVELEAQVHERTWDLEEANKALEVASMVDPLTGLKNRRFLRLAMPEAEARSVRAHRQSQEGIVRGEDLLFFMVDLDHFKEVNDVHGHAAGDAVLHQVAEVLRATCRESDTVVRWGGEEFLIMAAGADRLAAGVIAENICNQFRTIPFHLPDGTTLQKTCSVGFAAFPLLPGYPTAHPWESAVEVADQCLYAAKKSGRDGWVGVFRGDLDISDALQERLPGDVPGLVKEGALTLQCSFPNPDALTWVGS